MAGIEGGYKGGEKDSQIGIINPDVLFSQEGKEIKSEMQGDINKLKGNITYEQLNKLDIGKRLYFVTKNKVKSSDLVKGKKIKFDFHGNVKLYKRTSAGFIIPNDVIEVEAGGKKWTRDKNNKEFFYSNNKDGTVDRLIIGSFGNQNKGIYSEIIITKLKWSKEIEIPRKEIIPRPEIKRKSIQKVVIKSTKSRIENLLLSNLSNISDIEDPNSLRQGDHINFNFFTKELYLKTSAGKFIPSKINYLKTLDGQIWIRKDGKGEFFNKNGRRLTIGDKKYTRGYPSLQVISELEAFKVSTYRELLKLPLNYRLQNISDVTGDSSSLKTGVEIKIDSIKGVGLGNASLGEVIPIEVRSVKKDGKTYNRLLNDETVKGNITKSGGEFLDENMNRLRITNGDSITVGEVETIEKVQNNINNHLFEISSLEYKAEIEYTITRLSQQYQIPSKYIFALLKGENNKQDYLLKVKGKNNSAFGLLQMINSTWNLYGKGLNRKNPNDQLRAGFNYLNNIKRLILRRSGNKNMTSDELGLEIITFYHTGINILAKRHNNVEYRSKILEGNAPIKPFIAKIKGIKVSEVTANNITTQDYLAGAREYYKSKVV